MSAIGANLPVAVQHEKVDYRPIAALKTMALTSNIEPKDNWAKNQVSFFYSGETRLKASLLVRLCIDHALQKRKAKKAKRKSSI